LNIYIGKLLFTHTFLAMGYEEEEEEQYEEEDTCVSIIIHTHLSGHGV